MKTILSLLTGLLLTVSALAGTVRITFNANNNKDIQVVLDGTTYYSDDYVNTASKQLVLGNLQTGEHSVVISQTNARGKTRELYRSTFFLESNQDIHLTVNNNGSISREESFSHSAYGAMSDASFNEIYRDVSNQWTQANKVVRAQDVFNTASYYFSSDQTARIIALINREPDRLLLAKLSYDNVVDRENFTQVYSLLNSQANRDELDDYVRYYGNQTGSGAMGDVAFNHVLTDIRGERTQRRKMAEALSVLDISSNYFTAAQVRQIVLLVNNENNRVELLKASLDNMIDKENFSDNYDIIYRKANRDELDAYLRDQGYDDGSTSVNIAMSDVVFTQMYNDIEAIWWPGGEMSAIRDAFNVTTNYFTTAQAKRLIELVSMEANRVELAKLAYDNIVDRNNFRLIYDLLEKQASKDEVDAYVRGIQ